MQTVGDKIALKIKELRYKKGLDQKTLAQRSGVSRAYISLLETGRKTAAVSTLSRIADALGIRMGDFFDDDESFQSPKIVITTMDNALSESQQKNSFGYTYTPLSRGKRNKLMDTFLLHMEPGEIQKEAVVHKGEEFNIVLQGHLKVVYEGEEYVLNPGDSVYFESSTPHRFEAMGDQPLILVSVNCAATRALQQIEDQKKDGD